MNKKIIIRLVGSKGYSSCLNLSMEDIVGMEGKRIQLTIKVVESKDTHNIKIFPQTLKRCFHSKLSKNLPPKQIIQNYPKTDPPSQFWSLFIENNAAMEVVFIKNAPFEKYLCTSCILYQLWAILA